MCPVGTGVEELVAPGYTGPAVTICLIVPVRPAIEPVMVPETFKFPVTVVDPVAKVPALLIPLGV
jgi:hypothetical protein